MKIRPEIWTDLSKTDKFNFIVGRRTYVCLCNNSIGESCKNCENIQDIPFEDRNFHEELSILLFGWARESNDPDPYWLYLSLLELDNELDFNNNVKHYFMSDDIIVNIENEDEFNNAWYSYHKSIRQCDYYTNLNIIDVKTKEHLSPGIIDSMLHTFLNMSDVPYRAMKKLLSL